MSSSLLPLGTGIIEELLLLDGVQPGLIDALEGSVILEVKPALYQYRGWKRLDWRRKFLGNPLHLCRLRLLLLFFFLGGGIGAVRIGGRV